VTDYAMPGMNGAVLVREARRLVPDPAVLVVTGYASKPDGIGHVAALLKPFKPADLASRLFEILHPGRPENVVPFSANRKA
jgi:CheY-like chemotaxis protein